MSAIGASEFADRIRPHLLAPQEAHAAARFRIGFGADEKFLDVAEVGHRFRPAAVLVAVIDRPEGATVLLTERCSHLADHAGQISFPGGRFGDGDDGPVACALREAEEEVGLPRGHDLRIVGALEARGTISNYRVTPVVAVVAPFAPVAQREEVAEIFETPLDFVLDPANHEGLRVSPADGRSRRMYAIRFERHFIFGFTARILVQLSEIWSGGLYNPDESLLGRRG